MTTPAVPVPLSHSMFFFCRVLQVRNDEWEHVKTMKALQRDVSVERERR